MLEQKPDASSAVLVVQPPSKGEIGSPSALEAAILETVLYSDLFSYPLTPAEIQRFLIGQAHSLAEIEHALQTSPYLQSILEQAENFVFIRGRSETIARRHARTDTSAHIWRRTRFYLRLLRAVPFLRTALVTGALALDNAPADDDIDLLLLTAPNRLWLCRAFIIAIVRLAALQGVTLCPNYLLTTEVLDLDERNLYTAHELAQMRFLFGKPDYLVLLEKNRWAAEFLPNALPTNPAIIPDIPAPWWVTQVQRISEKLLGGRLGQRFEDWERQRKIKRFNAMGGDETNFSDKICKGHYNGHAGRTLLLLAERMAEFSPGSRGQA